MYLLLQVRVGIHSIKKIRVIPKKVYVIFEMTRLQYCSRTMKFPLELLECFILQKIRVVEIDFLFTRFIEDILPIFYIITFLQVA